MARLQEDKARLQEELAALRERLALRDRDQQATSTQLQSQVPGEEGRAEATAHRGAGRRTSPRAPGTLQAPGMMDSWGLLSWLGSA